MKHFKSWLRATLIALLATAAMLLVHQWIFVRLFNFHGPVMEFIIPVTLAAWLGGWRAGLMATLFSACTGVYLFTEHMGVSSLPRPFQLRLSMFVVISASLSLLVDSLHATRRRLEDRQRGLEQEIHERQRAEAALQQQHAQLLSEIARREQIEQELCEREERFRMAVESADIGTWDFNPITGDRNWSARAKEMFGLAPDADVSFTSYLDRFHPDDRESAERAAQQALDPRGDGRYGVNCRLIWPDGSIHWFIVKGQAFFQGQGAERHAVRFIGTVLEITERMKAIEALEAEQELLRHTIEIQDEERQLVTCEIHDGVVQYAAGALMQLEAARSEIESAATGRKIDQVMSILRKTVAEGRRLINGIRTPVLDDWGVVAALENLIDEEDRANVQVEFVKDTELGRMAANVEEALYRITQEAMTNTYKHSRTAKVRIELLRRGDRVRLEVRDWGVGFTPAARTKRVHGLQGMTTRARIAGGNCTIVSVPGEGTQIVAELPYLSRT